MRKYTIVVYKNTIKECISSFMLHKRFIKKKVGLKITEESDVALRMVVEDKFVITYSLFTLEKLRGNRTNIIIGYNERDKIRYLQKNTVKECFNINTISDLTKFMILKMYNSKRSE